MNKAIAIARREIEERRFVFIAAAAIMLAPFLAFAFPHGSMSDRLGTFTVLSIMVAINFVGGLSAVLGASLVGRELTEKRMSFYFSRPVAASTIWFGKLMGALALIGGCAAILILPSALYIPRLAATAAWISLPVGFIVLLTGSILTLLAVHVLSTMLRSRSPLLAADFVVIIVFSLCFFGSVLPLMGHHAAGLTVAIFAFVALAFMASVIAGGARQLSRGRIETKRNHRELSRVLWVAMGVTAALMIGFSFWVMSATARDLEHFYTEQGPAGSWVFTVGHGQHRIDYTAGFLVDVASGASIEVPPQFQWFGDINDSGTAAAWVQPTSTTAFMFGEMFSFRNRSRLLEVMVAPLTGHPAPRPTGIFVTGLPQAIDVTPDLTRIAVVNSETLSIYEVPTGKTLGSAHIAAPTARDQRYHVRFSSPDSVLLVHLVKDENNTHTIRVQRFDTSNHQLQTLIDTESRGQFVGERISADGRTMLLRTFRGKVEQPSAPVRLFDIASGTETVSIPDDPSARVITAWLLDDRHFAVTTLIKGDGRLRLYEGSTMQRDADLGPAAMLHIDAAKANGQFIVSKSDITCNQRVAMLVDPERGVIAQATGLMAIQPHTSGVAVSAGRDIEPLYADATGAHYTWNPATGERKRVF